jgi:enamine deaminase RidA (YjgF/YER057c/UK114 family)
MTVEEKLQQMGLELPEAPTAVAAYVPCLRSANLVFVSGQVPLEKGAVKYRGHLGADISLEDGRAAAQLCALNALAVVKREIGDWSRLRRIVKVTGFVASAAGFSEQHKVMNGASRLLIEVLEEKGRHTRSAVGVAELPLNACVELEMIVEVESEPRA